MRVLEILLRWDLPRVDSQIIIIVLLVSFGSSFTLFPHCKALPFYLNTSPVSTCLVHNCESSRKLVISICYHPCFEIKFPLIPHQRALRALAENCSGSLFSHLGLQSRAFLFRAEGGSASIGSQLSVLTSSTFNTANLFTNSDWW